MFSPPLCVYFKGEFSEFNKKKIKIYKEDNPSQYAKSIEKYLLERKEIKEKNFIEGKDFQIIPLNFLLEYETIGSFDQKKSYLFYHSISKDHAIRRQEIVSGMIDFLIIPEASYHSQIVILVDLMLEQGKKIIIFPNSIFSKKANFSNYLIKNGAIVATMICEVENLLDQK